MSTLLLAEKLAWLTQPRKFDAHQVNLSELSAANRDWLQVEDSMTAAIAAHFDTAPVVNVHFSGPSPLLAWEAKLLQATAAQGGRGFARQITLTVNDLPVLAARSVCCTRQVEQELTELRTTPLAQRLFIADQWTRYTPTIPLRIQPGPGCEAYYGRVCGWQLTAQAATAQTLLVQEYFLPDLLLPRTC